jgi:hypothetical protein
LFNANIGIKSWNSWANIIERLNDRFDIFKIKKCYTFVFFTGCGVDRMK